MRKLFLLLCIFTVVIAGCSGGGASVAPAASVSGDGLPPEPDRTANNATLAGIDSDGDGVRDDVQRLIHKTYTSTTKRALATALAKEFRKIYVATPTTPVEARKIADSNHRAWECLYSISMPSDEQREMLGRMESAHADTSLRMKAYINYNNLLHGQTFYSRSNEAGLCGGILP